MLNRRHKTVLFITLVATGSALLAGASLGEGLGIFILGATFAWVIGSGSHLEFSILPGKFQAEVGHG